MNSAAFIPMEYDIFAGLDVDKRRIAVTFTGHQGLCARWGCPTGGPFGKLCPQTFSR